MPLGVGDATGPTAPVRLVTLRDARLCRVVVVPPPTRPCPPLFLAKAATLILRRPSGPACEYGWRHARPPPVVVVVVGGGGGGGGARVAAAAGVGGGGRRAASHAHPVDGAGGGGGIVPTQKGRGGGGDPLGARGRCVAAAARVQGRRAIFARGACLGRVLAVFAVVFLLGGLAAVCFNAAQPGFAMCSRRLTGASVSCHVCVVRAHCHAPPLPPSFIPRRRRT